jgi:hypothetical protein
MRRIIQRTVITVKIVSMTVTYSEETQAADASANGPQIDRSEPVLEPIEQKIEQDAPPVESIIHAERVKS